MTDNPEQAFRAALLAGLGHAPAVIEPGTLHRFATRDRHGDSAGWCKLFEDQRGGVFGCYRQGINGTWSASGTAEMTQAQRADHARQVVAATARRAALQRRRWTVNAARNATTWAQCLPLAAGDPVTLYLERRGLAGLQPLPAALRLHPGMAYWHGADNLGTFPAMVAPISAPGGRVVALHRTYLTLDGCKADVPSPKKLTGAAGPLTGAGISLHQPARGCIGIAEGIETALAAWCASAVPTVAAYCAGNLAAWRWPPNLQRLVIFADADKAGREAADTLRARALGAQLRCDVLTPTTERADWCDVWAERGAVLTAAGAAS